MADYWTTPKINWTTSDGIDYTDLNRMEANTSGIRDASYRKVQGLGYSIDNSIVGKDGVITFTPGSCYSENGFPMKSPVAFVKNLTTWAAGNGSAFGGMASAVTPAAHTWYYAFLIMNPTDGSVEIMIDDDPDGANISSGVYTEKRFVNSFKTGAAGADSSFDLVEMYSTGDKVFINPDSMYTNRLLEYTSPEMAGGAYKTITLTDGATKGYALPAREVLAELNIENYQIYHVGMVSLCGGVFTVPTSLVNGTYYQGEIVIHTAYVPLTPDLSYADVSIMVDENRQLAMAIDDPTTGATYIAVRGFTDERII